MFNRGRFNLQRFNLPAGGEFDTYVREVLTVVFSSMVTNGGNAYVVMVANDGFVASADGAAGMQLGPTLMGDAINSVAGGYVIFFAAASMQSIVSGSVHPSQDALIIVSMEALTKSKAFLSSNLQASFAMNDAFRQSLNAAKNFTSRPIVFTSIVDAQVTTFEFSVDYTTLAITLAPGDTIIVDSNNFVVFHNGENAIDVHSGIWPELTRESYDIQVTSGTLADLLTSILYTERYL